MSVLHLPDKTSRSEIAQAILAIILLVALAVTILQRVPQWADPDGGVDEQETFVITNAKASQ